MGRVTRPLVFALALLLVQGGLARPVAAQAIEPQPAAIASAPAASRTSANEPRLLVKFAPDASAAARLRAIASVGGTVDRVLGEIGVTRIAVPFPATEDGTGLAALRLARDPAVVSVEPDSTGAVQFTPNDAYWLTDPGFGVGQWGLRATQVDKAWDVVRGSPAITVAVIDTGIDANHPDLAGVALPGITFVSSPDPSCTAGTVIDDNGHGTHVAGVIAANGNNGQGVAGVAFGVRILPVKALDCTGSGLLSDVASGVTWATDHGARVINISLGSSSAQATLQDAIRYAIAHNVLVVAAAGNCGVTSTRCASVNEPQYPGAYPETLAVAAVDQGDVHAAFSNSSGYVGISAPGVRIWGTTPTYPTTLSRQNPSSAGYAAFSGTSQAAPLVAGIAALMLSGEPGLTAPQLADRLRATADDLGAPGMDPVFGAGKANALRAVTTGAAVRYGAAYDVASVPKTATITAPLLAAVTLTNRSSFAWPAAGANPVKLAYHWADLAGNTVVWDGQRSLLPADVPIGGTATVNAAIVTPKTTGTYVLRLDLVREGVAWFSTNGAPTANVTIGVTSGLAASYAPTASAQSTFVLGPNAFSVSVSNTGTVPWPSAGATPVHLSYHWLSPIGQVVVWEGTRANLPVDVAPGQTAVVTLNVASPPATGPYTLRLDLVQEGVTWFSGQGVTPRDLAISVTNGFGATFSSPAPATSLLPGSRAVFPVTLTNTGLVPWSAGGPNPVHAAAHVYDLAARVLVWDGERAVLPNDVAPGQSVTVNVAVAVPPSASPARYLYRFDLVREGLAWFSGYGVTLDTGSLSADTDYRASFLLASTTISRAAPSVTVAVTNTSQIPWTPGGTAPLDLGSHWLAADGTPLVWDGPRVPLTAQPIAPGTSVTITLPLAPPPPGAVSLVVDIVAEGLRWFGSGSAKPVTLVP
jgi:subtilisin family serine protease